jgi:RNA polymerase sigma factor (sigma-70 family)
MADTQLNGALARLHAWRESQTLAEAPDAELLQRFTAAGEEAAFAALLRRHGPMVLGVCRRLLGHAQDAEDAYQATFLVLARKAACVRKRASVGSFLHGVAHRLALKARAQGVQRQVRERRAADMRSKKPDVEAAWQEVQTALDAALEDMPERYRSALVLCYLEGKSHQEAADLLGCPLPTLRTRVARGRKLLRDRLAGRGLTLSATALAALLVAGTAPAAAPAALARATLKAALSFAAGKAAAALCSNSVAGLAEGGLKAMSQSKLKVSLAVLLAAGFLSGAAALAHGFLAQDKSPARDRVPAAAAKAAESGDVEVAGRVLDPDCKPLAGAHLFWPRLLREPPMTEDDITWDRKADSAADGTFRLKLARNDLRRDFPTPLVAAANGFGVDWVQLSQDDAAGERTFRLTRDVPIRGRLQDTQGKPLAGARVQVIGILEPDNGKLDTFLAGWKQNWQDAERLNMKKRLYGPLDKLFSVSSADKDGRFQITGAGAERLVQVQVEGPAAKTCLYVVTRPGVDTKAINAAVLDGIPKELRIPGQPPLLHGTSFDYVAGPARRLEGTVREAGTGTPLAGMPIMASGDFNSGSMAVSDAKGRFTLTGLPKRETYDIHVSPPKGSSLLARTVRLPDDGGLGPISCDIELARGVLVTGRLIDRATGKGIKGGLRFAPLPGNKYFGKKPVYDSYRYERFTHDIDSEGRFRIVVMPSAGVLLVQAYTTGPKINGVAVNPYKQVELDAADRERIKPFQSGESRSFTAADNTYESLSLQHAIKVLALPEGAAPTTCELFAERGSTLSVHVLDTEGKPLAGATVSGMTASWPITFTLEGADCVAYALDPKKPRRLLFLHPGRKLAGTLTVRGDEKEAPTVRLMATGSVRGRALDLDGRPVAGADVRLSYADEAADELIRHLKANDKPVRTDKDGRFLLEGLVPDVKFGLGVYQGKKLLVGEPRIGLREVKLGATLDLGDFRTKPGS